MSAPRYISTDGATRNRVNLSLLFPAIEPCPTGGQGCGCASCSTWRARPITARLAQLIVETCEAFVERAQLDRKGFFGSLRDRLPTTAGLVPDSFLADFVTCFIGIKQSIESGRLGRATSTADELALHMVLDDVSLRIIVQGGSSWAVEAAEMLEHLAPTPYDHHVERVRERMFDDQYARTLWCDDLVVSAIPNRPVPGRNLNWSPSLWFVPYTG